MVRRRILLVIVALALGAFATQVAAHVATLDHDAAAQAEHSRSDRHVAAPVAAARALRAVDTSTPWEPAVGLAVTAVVAAFAFTRRRDQVLPARRVLWDAGDDWRSLLVGAPPAV